MPHILLRKQVELGLSPTDMLVLINITMHWWYREQLPFPRSATIAERMGVDARTVQRSIRKMQDLKLVERETETLEDGTTRSVLNLSPLVKRLSGFARRDRLCPPRPELCRADATERGRMKEPDHYTFEFERADMKIRFSAGGAVALITAVAILGLVATIVVSKYL